MKTPVFTSTVSPALLAWMEGEAKRTKRTRRAVLEDALTRYRRDATRERMRRDLSGEDRALALEMVEWGIGEYGRDLEKHD